MNIAILGAAVLKNIAILHCIDLLSHFCSPLFHLQSQPPPPPNHHPSSKLNPRPSHLPSPIMIQLCHFWNRRSTSATTANKAEPLQHCTPQPNPQPQPVFLPVLRIGCRRETFLLQLWRPFCGTLRVWKEETCRFFFLSWPFPLIADTQSLCVRVSQQG